MPSEVTKVSFGDGQTIDIPDLGIGDRNVAISDSGESAGVRIDRVDLHPYIATEARGLVRGNGPQELPRRINHRPVARALSGHLGYGAVGLV